jgi:hypothetical protein
MMHRNPALTALHDGLASSTDELRRRFGSARPFPHVVIDRFLEPGLCRALIEQFPPYEAERFVNHRGDPGKGERRDVRRLGPAYERLDDLLGSPSFLGWVSAVTGIDSLEYDPEYHGGGTHENLDGMGLPAHVDFNYIGTTSLRRRLNLLLYLNPRWEPSWGGELQLHPDPRSDSPEAQAGVETIAPLANRCVLFATGDSSWHGVRPVRLPPGQPGLSRRSIAAYFYRRDRLWEPRAPVHPTIWVYPRLPERFSAGRTLDERDVSELRRLLAVRDLELEDQYRWLRMMLTKLRPFSALRAGFAILRRLLRRSPP